MAERKSAVLPFSTVSAIPRVRTHHTRKSSRFVHALSARPLKVQGGRGWSKCADGTIKINPISLCSHTDAHPNLNREVRHSPTWHSSKSESALERFYVSIRRKQAVPCLGDAVQRWLRHPEPFLFVTEKYDKEKKLSAFSLQKTHQTKKRMANHPFSFKNSIIQ